MSSRGPTGLYAGTKAPAYGDIEYRHYPEKGAQVWTSLATPATYNGMWTVANNALQPSSCYVPMSMGPSDSKLDFAKAKPVPAMPNPYSTIIQRNPIPYAVIPEWC